jgi:uncharacterized membrane protein YagU involved in acid resistance
MADFDIYSPVRSSHGKGMINVLPKYLFLGIALLGAISIWTIKSLFPGTGQMVAVFFAVFLILSYCVISYKVQKFSLREDMIGDNAYYLGFLFTLTSLSYALSRLISDQTGADTIIESFGVALWSTIAGIVARVFFSQLRQDPDDIEKDARAKISQTARELSVELGSATVSFNEYRRAMEQSIAEVMRENQTGAIDYTKKIAEESERLVKTMEGLSTKLSEIETPDSLMGKKFDNLFSHIDAAGAKLSTMVDAQANSVANILATTQAIQDKAAALGGVIDGIAKQNSGVDEFLTGLKGLTPTLQHISSALEQVAANQNENLEKIRTHSDELAKELTRSRGYTEDTHSALSSMVQTLAAKLT